MNCGVVSLHYLHAAFRCSHWHYGYRLLSLGWIRGTTDEVIWVSERFICQK